MSTYAGEPELAGESGWARALRGGIDRLLAIELHLTLEFWLYAALMVVVLVMRFADLGTKALHHDESLHATYSYYLATGKGYVHDPLMHGPFLFHITALVYWLFGASDASSRFAPALLGSVAVLMPLFLRPWLGRAGAFAAALFIAFSPSLLYYDRFIRNEPWVVLWTLGLIVCIFRYRLEQRDRYLYGAAAFLMFEFVSKETAFIISAILVLYLAGCGTIALLREWFDQMQLLSDDAGVRPGWLWNTLREGVLRKPLPTDAKMFLVLALLAAPQFSAAVRIPLKALHYDINAVPGYTIFEQQLTRVGFVGGITVIGMIALTVVIGIWWDLRRWLICLIVFYVPYFLLYTTFFHNTNGWGSGIWGSLAYWLDQQDVRRGTQPVFYYAMTLPTYEYLTLGLAAAGLVWHAVRRGPNNLVLLLSAVALLILLPIVNTRAGNTASIPVVVLAIGLATMAMEGDGLRLFLVFYFGALFFGLSVAGEKMPWLTVHLALPLTLLAALFVRDVFGVALWPRRRAIWSALVILGLVAAGAAALIAARGTPAATAALAGVALLVTIVCAVAYLARMLGLGTAEDRAVLGWAGAAVGVVAFAGFFGVLTLRNDYRMNWIHPDTPDEMLIYTQSSPDIPKLMKQIDQLAMESGQGHKLKITVDSNDAFTWPWAWYLRDYANVGYPDLTSYAANPTSAASLDTGDVLLLNAADQNVIGAFPGKYGPGERYHHRWWFPEDGYRTTTASTFWQRVKNGSEFTRWWTYVTNRKGLAVPPSDVSPGPNQQGPAPVVGVQAPAGAEYLGTVDSVAYFPANWVPGKGINAAPVAAPASQAHQVGSTLTIGTLGVAPGQLRRPAGVATDAQGDIYVADSLNNRVQKFDRNGSFVAQAGTAGTSVLLHEPWGIAVDGDGNVYVADTWSHRIVKLDPNLKILATWGQPNGPNGPGSPLDLYGPRAIAIDAAGHLWVTDTGNERVIEFDKNGKPLATFGTKGSGPGQFDEPVGIAIAPDGTIYVADTWNNRVQAFDPSFTYKSEFQVQSWVQGQTGRDVENKPYLAALPDGTLLVTFPAGPAGARLIQYDAHGTVLRTFDRLPGMATPLQHPIGVAVSPAGEVLLSDGVLHEVVRVPASALP